MTIIRVTGWLLDTINMRNMHRCLIGGTREVCQMRGDMEGLNAEWLFTIFHNTRTTGKSTK